MSDQDFNDALEQAKSTVAELDRIDGFKDRNIQLICAALETGLRKPETNAAFDALVMLRELCKMEGRN